MATNFFKIEIDGKQFETHYLVYVVNIFSEQYGDFFYVGQTGDRYHLSARPAFRRLAGHLSDQGSSTENQIYRQIATKILRIEIDKAKKAFEQNVKDSVTQFLSKSKISMLVYPIEPFLSNSDVTKHKENRELAEKIENEIINSFIRDYGIDKVLNKKYTLTSEIGEKTEEIMNHLKQELK